MSRTALLSTPAGKLPRDQGHLGRLERQPGRHEPRRGMLFKNALALETSAQIQAVVMDKTGTLTKGEPQVTGVVTDGLPEREVLRLAAAVEQESAHLLAEAVVNHAHDLATPGIRRRGSRTSPGTVPWPGWMAGQW